MHFRQHCLLSIMKKPFTILMACASALLPAMPLPAAERHAAVTSIAALSLEFVEVDAATGPDAWLDLKTIHHDAKSRERFTRVRRRFGIRVLRAGGAAWGTAAVTARLDAPDGRSTVRVDGRPLSLAPLVIDARAAVGAVTMHTLEVEVPDAVPEGPLAASIAWEVTTE